MAHELTLGPDVIGVIYYCDWCGGAEERLFKDTLTELELCAGCLWGVVEHIDLSPSENGDNLRKVLTDKKGPQCGPDA